MLFQELKIYEQLLYKFKGNKLYYKVEESPDLVRDSDSNAVLNINNTGLQAYKNRKKQFSKINNVEQRVEDMDARLLSIENLLISLKTKLDNV